jgi:hypothetical protein
VVLVAEAAAAAQVEGQLLRDAALMRGYKPRFV